MKNKLLVALMVVVFIVSAMPLTVSVSFGATSDKTPLKLLQWGSSEGYVLSNDPSYSPDVREFLQIETLYVKAWSSRINPNYLVEAYCEVGGHRFGLSYDGTLTPRYSYTGSFSLSTLGPGSWNVYIRLESRIWWWSRVYEASDKITVLGEAPAPDFTIDADPSTLSIVAGSFDTSTITVGSLNGFNEQVDLTVSGEPENVIATLDPVAVTPTPDGTATSTLMVEVGGTAAPGEYTLTVTGTNGSLSHSTDVTLEITAAPSTYTLTVHVQNEADDAIEDATVSVDGLSKATDSSGDAVFPDLVEGTYTVTASKTGYVSSSTTVDLTGDTMVTLTLTSVPPFDYELFIEIDYIEGHEPTQADLNYIEQYYLGNNPSGDRIKVTFRVDDEIELSPTYADGINDDEFWAIEAAVNDLGDDKYGAVDPVFGTDGVYSSKWKWVLYGTTVEGSPNVVGYTYVLRQRVGWFQYDLLAGNYIFIADETADDWATDNGVEPYGAEAVVLMHEMGHSIGIGKLDWRGNEVYCSNSECVMSYLSVDNADNYMVWFYCRDHWATRNMGYYER